MTALAWPLWSFRGRRGAVRPWLLVATSEERDGGPQAATPADLPPSGSSTVPGPRDPSDDREPDDEASPSDLGDTAAGTPAATAERVDPADAPPSERPAVSHDIPAPRQPDAVESAPPSAGPEGAGPIPAGWNAGPSAPGAEGGAPGPYPGGPPTGAYPTVPYPAAPPGPYGYPGQFGGPPPGPTAYPAPPEQYAYPPQGPAFPPQGQPAYPAPGGLPPEQPAYPAPGQFGSPPEQLAHPSPEQFGGPVPQQPAYAPPGLYGGPPPAGALPGQYHRNSGGRAQPYAAVAQAGTAVLLDDRGVPRVRCADGAPLTGVQPLADPIHDDGWTGFDPASMIEIQPAGAAVVEFGLVDAAGAQPFRRPTGTVGSKDVAALPDTGRLDGFYVLTGTQTRCEGLQDCPSTTLNLTSRFRGCPDACTVSDPELGEGVPLTREGGVWRAGGTVPTDRRGVICETTTVPYSFTTTVTVRESGVRNGVWTATRLAANHELRVPASAACTAAFVAWSVDGPGGG